MMWSVLGVLVTAVFVQSYSTRDTYERLAHGRQLKIYLNKNTEKLEFTPANNPGDTLVYYDKFRSSTHAYIRGKVSGSGNDRRWYLDHVIFDDMGTYTQKDHWGHEISSLKVTVVTKNNFEKRKAGRSLYISLEGLRKEDATLSFSGESANVTLVRDGALVSQDLPDYFDRVRLQSTTIEILGVNVSDVGHYYLKDRFARLVSTTRMDLTDEDDPEGNPLLALLLLLGIPAGVCCCCRKKIFKKKASTAQTLQPSPGVIIAPGPTGPAPPYNQPQPGYYPPPSTDLGPSIHPPPVGPSPGFNPAYPAPNPGYPAPNPGYPAPNPGYPATNPGYPAPNSGYPAANPSYPAVNPGYPAPNPGYTPAGPYPLGPNAPMGYSPAPAMYSEPPPKEEIKMENMAPAAPTDPLLAQPPQTSPSAPAPATALSSDTAATFEIGKGANFL